MKTEVRGITEGSGYVERSRVTLDRSPESLNVVEHEVPPTVNDDVDLGYGVGCYWYDTTADKAYVCLDAADGAAVWIAITTNGVVVKTIDHTWAGDNSNNRDIDLGDDYDYIEIMEEGDLGSSTPWAPSAIAFRTAYTIYRFDNGTGKIVPYAGSFADVRWQGKLTGGDSNKIRLGTSGATSGGLNVSGRNYRLRGIKYSSME